ncbi:efflux transporter outer membrane subunit [Comamonas sp. GB3 AK4-5]|uniref:efflux transporter outer membrane subunit n=1 Tax=Comamonas sp. GB3 AK4-5 TaxID=3231487 RepID=UPI00351DE3EE
MMRGIPLSMAKSAQVPGRLALMAVAAALVAGCSMAPVYQRPAAPVPAVWAWSADSGTTTAPAASTLAWQDFVTDALLRQRIEQALTHNRDLRQALLDVEAARAMYGVQRADRLPGVEVQASGNRQRLPGDLSATGTSAVQSSYQAGVGLAAFELDLFGRVRNLSEAALQEYLASEEAARSVQISLVAEVVQASLLHDSARQRVALTQRTLASREAALQLVQQRRQHGLDTALDLHEAESLTEQARTELERSERQYRQAGNALELLLGQGQNPQDQVLNQALANLPLVQDIGAGMPADLLTQRPDIRAAERQLQSRNASIGAARAAFFPRISLTGSLGSSSAELSNLFHSGQRSWSFMPQLQLPIFDGGRNQANLDLAQVRKDMAVVAYEKSIQTAFREVADALAATDTLRREEAAQRKLVTSSAKSLTLAQARYRAGVDSHLRYLDAERSHFASQLALIDVATERQIALTTLYKALGGGWSTKNTP